MYINCHSYFSLKYGMLAQQTLLKTLVSKGVKVAALTDINNTSAVLDTLRLAKDEPIRIVPGIDFRNGAQQQFIGLAKNNQGFAALNYYLSTHLHSGLPFPSKAPVLNDVFIVYPYKQAPTHLLPYEYVGIRPEELTLLPFSKWKNKLDKLLVLQPVTFFNKQQFNAHRILRAIDNNVLLSQLPKSEEASPNDVFIDELSLRNRFKDYPQIIDTTYQVLNACRVDFDFKHEKGHNNLQHYTGNANLDFRLLKKLCFEGLPYRYREVNDAILDRINKELKTIKEKGFVAYFLIAWKVLKYARSCGYFYVGRGSGANSIVAYLIRITDIDPIELDLYFERFINLFRNTPPDFDIDFSWKDREDVTAYIFHRFKNVALLAAYSTFKDRSVIREVSKTFGLPDHEIKKLQQYPHTADSMGKLVLKYSKLLQGFPSHLTVHAAGIIISEKPLYNYAATFMPPKGFPTIQFDMHIAEDMALYKFDILGQRGLAKIKEALAIIKGNRPGTVVDIHDMRKIQGDESANNLLKNGGAIGCFYVESPAMRMLLAKLQVADYLGLVAASSVIRPGVAQSGMMREYILRYRSEERRKWAQEQYPVLYKLMPETYGVMVYQEDVIKVAHYFAGLSLAEADVLRRGMSGKYRSREEFKEVEGKFFNNCKAKGIAESFIREVWMQIESFAGYAFAKGHSASYAVESYQCLYLKAYYPLEFLVATINNGGGFYSAELYLHEAKKYGAVVHLPCINQSEALLVLYDKDVFLGLQMVAGVEYELVKAVLKERYSNGFYTSLADFLDRVSIGIEQLSVLIRANAFRFTQKTKKELLWEAHFLLSGKKQTAPSPSLFVAKPKQFVLPALWQHELEDIYDEIELLGFPVIHSPFELVTEWPANNVLAKLFPLFVGKPVTLLAYLVHRKKTQTKSKQAMYFGTLIDKEGDWVDTVVFPVVAQQYPFTGPGCYVLHGKVVEEFGHLSLEVIWQKRVALKNLDDAPSTRLKQISP